MQVSTSACSHAVGDDIADNARVAKQGWGQTKIGQVLQAKVSTANRCLKGSLPIQGHSLTSL